MRFLKTAAKAGAVLIVAVVAVGLATEEQGDVAASEGECGSPITAYVMSQDAVRAQLVSPSSAQFPPYTDPAVDVSADSECAFLVMAYVDAQNGFGAMLRSTYLADVTHDPEAGTWSVSDVRISD